MSPMFTIMVPGSVVILCHLPSLSFASRPGLVPATSRVIRFISSCAAARTDLSSSFPVNEGDEILISTNKGRVIRTVVKEIRVAGRNTQGVRIIKLSGEEKVVSAIKIDDNLI